MRGPPAHLRFNIPQSRGECGQGRFDVSLRPRRIKPGTSKDVEGNPYTIIGFGNGPVRLATRGAIDSTALENKDYRQEAVVPTDPTSDSETHGGADVFLGAQGLGADNFAGVLTNTDVFGLIKKAVGL